MFEKNYYDWGMDNDDCYYDDNSTLVYEKINELEKELSTRNLDVWSIYFGGE